MFVFIYYVIKKIKINTQFLYIFRWPLKRGNGKADKQKFIIKILRKLFIKVFFDQN